MPLLNSLATPYAEALLQITEVRGESSTVSCLLYTSDAADEP